MCMVAEEAVLAYQVFMTQVQGMLYLDGKKGEFNFLPFIFFVLNFPGPSSSQCLSAVPGFQPVFRNEVKNPKALADPANCWLFTL